MECKSQLQLTNKSFFFVITKISTFRFRNIEQWIFVFFQIQRYSSYFNNKYTIY